MGLPTYYPIVTAFHDIVSVVSSSVCSNPCSSKLVSSWNSFGYLFEHLLFFIHGEFGFNAPHGPCIICSATKQYPRGSIVGSRISALIKESMKVDVGCDGEFDIQNMMCE
jgi:hypothetical protein